MSLMILLVLKRSTKVSEKTDMAKSWAARLCRLPQQELFVAQELIKIDAEISKVTLFRASGNSASVGYPINVKDKNGEISYSVKSTPIDNGAIASQSSPYKAIKFKDFDLDYSRNSYGEYLMSIVSNVNIEGYKGQKLTARLLLWNKNGNRMYPKNMINGTREQICRSQVIIPSYPASDFKLSFEIPMSQLNVPLTDDNFMFSIDIYTDSGVKVCSKEPTLISTISYFVLLETNEKYDTYYTNSNPMYQRFRNGKDLRELYMIGYFQRGGFKGFVQSREIRPEGVKDGIYELENGVCKNGVDISYYQIDPEQVLVHYFENYSPTFHRYMKQSEAMRYKAQVHDELRRKNITPMSDRLQSKINTSYMSRNNETTFKGVNNPSQAVNKMSSSVYANRNTTTPSSSSYSRNSSSSSSPDLTSTAVIISGLAAIAYGIIKAGEAIDNTIKNTREAREREEAAQLRKVSNEEVYSKSNVEIVNWATYNWLAAAHAEVELRNKNNYDVIVNVSLYQGSWSEGRIIYTDLTKGDRIPGVSDEYSSDIRVKANSIRRVCLRADHSGRPTHIRISSVR